MWYYRDNVRKSLHRYKFYNARSYAAPYGRFLAMLLLNKGWTDFDLITWVPISTKRKLRRGFDQGQLLAKAVSRELGLPCVSTLKKHRNTPPQSGIAHAAERRANVLGAYHVRNRDRIMAKRILLLDDIITTGATASECARVLLTAGAKEVFFAAVAATDKG